MSIYCGFATRKLEEEYLGLIVRMLRLLCRKTTKHMKNESVDEIKFGQFFANLFGRLSKLEEQKYSYPKLSEATLELAFDLHLTDRSSADINSLILNKYSRKQKSNVLVKIIVNKEYEEYNTQSLDVQSIEPKQIHQDKRHLFDQVNSIPEHYEQKRVQYRKSRKPNNRYKNATRANNMSVLFSDLNSAKNYLYSSLDYTPNQAQSNSNQDQSKLNQDGSGSISFNQFDQFLVFKNGKKIEDQCRSVDKSEKSREKPVFITINECQMSPGDFQTIDQSNYPPRRPNRQEDYHEQMRLNLQLHQRKTKKIYQHDRSQSIIDYNQVRNSYPRGSSVMTSLSLNKVQKSNVQVNPEDRLYKCFENQSLN